jgi:hypothetical protein
MAGPIAVLPVTYIAGEDFSSSQYSVVVVGTSAYECKLPTAAGAGRILGILQNYPASGVASRVVKLGISKVVAAGTIAYGDELEIANVSGAVRKYTQDGDNGRVGTAEEAAVDNDIFTAFICPLDISQLLS